MYSYYELANYSTNYGATVAAGAAITTQGNNVQLGSIPNKVYIWATMQRSQQTFTNTDTFFAINSISILS